MWLRGWVLTAHKLCVPVVLWFCGFFSFFISDWLHSIELERLGDTKVAKSESEAKNKCGKYPAEHVP